MCFPSPPSADFLLGHQQASLFVLVCVEKRAPNTLAVHKESVVVDNSVNFLATLGFVR